MRRWFPTPAAIEPGGAIFQDVLPWAIVLVVVVIVGALIIAAVRRMLRPGRGGPGEGFTLQDLREMHAAGQLSDEEFRRARARMIGRLSAPGEHPGAGNVATGPTAKDDETF